MVERHLSDHVVQMMRRLAFGPSRIAPERQRELRGKFAALVTGEPRAEQMRLLFMASPRMCANAFALPDGRIYITDELVALASNDEQILAALAHEAGHHARRHGMRQAIENSSVFVAVALLFCDVSGSSLAVALPGILLSNGFSRGHEREADRYVLALLRRRLHSPAAFADVMSSGLSRYIQAPQRGVAAASRSILQRPSASGPRARQRRSPGPAWGRVPKRFTDGLQSPAYLGTPPTGLHRKSPLMVKIRLTRGGAKKRPFYHIIVTDSRSARDGRNIERVGFYNPVAAGEEKRVEMNLERVKHWIGVGAQMSDKVADLYKQASKQPSAAA